MISCKKATELISKSMDEGLSIKEELELKLHLFICEFCEAFKRQTKLIRKALGGKEDEQPDIPATSCDTRPAKERLKEKLRGYFGKEK